MHLRDGERSDGLAMSSCIYGCYLEELTMDTIPHKNGWGGESLARPVVKKPD